MTIPVLAGLGLLAGGFVKGRAVRDENRRAQATADAEAFERRQEQAGRLVQSALLTNRPDYMAQAYNLFDDGRDGEYVQEEGKHRFYTISRDDPADRRLEMEADTPDALVGHAAALISPDTFVALRKEEDERRARLLSMDNVQDQMKYRGLNYGITAERENRARAKQDQDVRTAQYTRIKGLRDSLEDRVKTVEDNPALAAELGRQIEELDGLLMGFDGLSYGGGGGAWDKSGDYGALGDKYAAEYGVPPELVRAVITAESAGNPKAVSHAGAQGLMQLMPITAKRFRVTDSFDPEQNIRGGVQYLAWLLDRYDGDVTKALAGYNAGEGRVDKYGGVPPFPETQEYVRKITGWLNSGPSLSDAYRQTAETKRADAQAKREEEARKRADARMKSIEERAKRVHDGEVGSEAYKKTIATMSAMDGMDWTTPESEAMLAEAVRITDRIDLNNTTTWNPIRGLVPGGRPFIGSDVKQQSYVAGLAAAAGASMTAEQADDVQDFIVTPLDAMKVSWREADVPMNNEQEATAATTLAFLYKKLQLPPDEAMAIASAAAHYGLRPAVVVNLLVEARESGKELTLKELIELAQAASAPPDRGLADAG